MIDLKDYICTVPFTSLEIMENQNHLCCASWLLKDLPNGVPLKDLWNSKEAVEIRESVMDGSYRFCDKKQCPSLSKLISLNTSKGTTILHKEDLPDTIKDNFTSKSGVMKVGPKIVQMSFDRTCNYKCPSCRVDMIVANSKKIKSINLTIDEMEQTFSNSVETIYCSGTADPFASVSYRNWLRTFDTKKYPKLKSIHLHTNASLWDKEMWDSMPNVHGYVKSCEISIDAGTAFTYETITRLGGNWENLLSNLKFISTIKELKSIKCSFVVQQSNYKEMKVFLDLMLKIFGNRAKVFFGRITNWGTFSDKTFSIIDVANKNHYEHSDFLNEFKKVATHPQVFHNMYEMMNIKKSII